MRRPQPRRPQHDRLAAAGPAAVGLVCVALLMLSGPPPRAQEDAAPAADGAPGKELYEKYCSQCHGDDGAGEGIAAPYVNPRPRDFTSGKYKIRMTPTGGVPTDADLERAIRQGLPYTAMPAFPNFTEQQLDQVVAYVKSFADDFEDPEAYLDPIDIPEPPPYSAEQAAKDGRRIYEETGCARCHGEKGRGDGPSAPTLVDDWGHHIRSADLTKPWTFRGGGTRRDIFRTMSTGFAGTPMPGFHGSLPAEDIWAISDYIYYLGGETTKAPYSNMVRAVATTGELDLGQGRELFADAPSALFRLVGQIMEPGRQFHPAVVEVEARALFNDDEIALMVSWNDMRAETVGSNAPDLRIPPEEQAAALMADETGDEDEGGFWGDAEADEGDDGEDFWGEAAVDEGEEASGEDFWGDATVDEEEAAGDDFWGDAAVDDAAADEGEEDAGDDFWGTGDDEPAAAAPTTPDTEFSDAVAIQLPRSRPQGIARPYFLFGDVQNPVELWYVDLASPDQSQLWLGRGSTALAPSDEPGPEVSATYEDGRWTVIYKRQRLPLVGVPFEDDAFLPIAFTVWDGFQRERGNRRGLTTWYSLYLEPLEKPSPIAPMIRTGVLVLLAELLLVLAVRWRTGRLRGA